MSESLDIKASSLADPWWVTFKKLANLLLAGHNQPQITHRLRKNEL